VTQSDLFDLYKKGRADLVLLCIESNPNLLQATDGAGNTILHLVLLNGHYNLARELLKQKAISKCAGLKNQHGMTPIECWAAVNDMQSLDISRLVTEDDAMIKAITLALTNNNIENAKAIMKAANCAGFKAERQGVFLTRVYAEWLLTKHSSADFTRVMSELGMNLSGVKIKYRASDHEDEADLIALLIQNGADAEHLTQLIVSSGVDGLLQVARNHCASAVHIAALKGKVELVRKLIEKGADLHKVQLGMQPPIHDLIHVIAQSSGDVSARISCAKAMLESLDVGDAGNKTLHAAVLHQILSAAQPHQMKGLIEVCIEKSSSESLGQLDGNGESMATKLVRLGLNSHLKQLCEKEPKVNIMEAGALGCNAWVEAFVAGNMEAIKYFIQNEQSVIKKAQYTNAIGANIFMLGLMLPDERGGNRSEILDKAIAQLHDGQNTAELMLQAKDENGLTPWHYAVMGGKASVDYMVDVLGGERAKYTDLNLPDNNGMTPLMMAVMHNKTEVAQALLGAGAHTALKDKSGNTALHMAVSSGNVGLVQVMLNAPDIEVNAANSDGVTPFHIAMTMAKKVKKIGASEQQAPNWENHKRIVQLLQQRGAAYSFDNMDESLLRKVAFTLLACNAASFVNKQMGTDHNALIQEAIAVSAAYKIAKDVKDKVQDGINAWLTDGTSLEKTIEIEPLMIGAFSVRGWFRWIESGESLKKRFSNSSLYKQDSVDRAIFDYRYYTPQNTAEAKEDHLLLLNRYVEIQSAISSTPFFFFWTKWQLASLAQEVLKADNRLKDVAGKAHLMNTEGVECIKRLKELVRLYGVNEVAKHIDKQNLLGELIEKIAARQIILDDIDLQSKVIMIAKQCRIMPKNNIQGATGALGSAIDTLSKQGNLSEQIQDLCNTTKQKFPQNFPGGVSPTQPDKLKERGLDVLAWLTGQNPEEAVQTVAGVVGNITGLVGGGLAYLNASGHSIEEVRNVAAVASVVLPVATSYAGTAAGVFGAAVVGFLSANAVPLLALAAGAAVLSSATRESIKQPENNSLAQAKENSLRMVKQSYPRAVDLEVRRSRGLQVPMTPAAHDEKDVLSQVCREALKSALDFEQKACRLMIPKKFLEFAEERAAPTMAS
jgi:ankyrin repeat protein